MHPQYTHIVFTRHARERMGQRVITEDMVTAAIQRPDRTYPEDDGDTKFIRRIDGVTLHVVCKPIPEEARWLVKSTWVRGEDDHGNRVDRYGRKLGRSARLQPRLPMRSIVVNALLITLLIGLLAVLLYVLSR